MKSVMARTGWFLGVAAGLVVAASCGDKTKSSPASNSKLVDAALEKASADAKKSPAKGEPPEDELASVARETRVEAEQGVAESQYLLGVLYANGRGVTRDFPEAYKWLQLAAAQGDAEAARALPLVRTLMTEKQIDEGKRRVATFVPATNSPALKPNPQPR